MGLTPIIKSIPIRDKLSYVQPRNPEYEQTSPHLNFNSTTAIQLYDINSPYSISKALK
jgi:hypothetical protein